MFGLQLSHILLQSTNGFVIIAGSNRRDRSLQGACFADVVSLHIFQKLRPDFSFFDQLENCLSLGLIYCASGAIVIIPDNYDVEDVADDVAPEKRIGAPY